MKQLLVIVFAFATLTTVAQLPTLEIGDKIPDSSTKMECTTSGQHAQVSDLKGENGLLIIFSSNSCPFVVAWEDRYPMVSEIAKSNNVGFALINSNFKKRNGDDSVEAMKDHAKKNNYKWPYLVDVESKLANSMGAQTTPHVYLFDKDLNLVYKGAIDDNHKNAANVKAFYLKDALNSLGNGQEIQVKETRNLGCSIKRKTI